MSLESGVHVKPEGITQETLDVMIEVAKGSGFKIRDEYYDIRGYNEAIAAIKGCGYLINCTTSKEISVNDWLFSLAPDWAVDIRKMTKPKYFIYTDGKLTSEKIVCEHQETEHPNVDKCEVIAVRQPKKEQWQPKVGEKVTYPSGQGVLVIEEPDGNGVVIVKDEQGEYRRVSVVNIKPLPTEEEKLIEEAMSHLKADLHEGNEEDICRDLIKAGYRKVEPIDYERFEEIWKEFDGVSLKKFMHELAGNNHIVVKGE